MKKITINIKSEHAESTFEQILWEYGFNGLIPSNKFINKVRPGIGGTTVELKAARHSIIIEPYVTVMEVKKTLFRGDLCIVMDGVHNLDIENYLNDSSVIYKKLMTTPEGFSRLIMTLKSYDVNYRKNFFLLYDESDKLVEQSLFRNRLLDPLDEFFQFENKAFISATPIILSDERLNESFEMLEFVPEWDYRKELTLITTDNIRTSLRNLISLYNDNKPVFIFTNCKQSILYISRLLPVADDYKIFCAERLDEEFFKDEDVLNVEYSVKEQNYAKYNIFTSRFFSAVDMFYAGKVKPHILMITNIPTITHSLINPATQAIQIQGRCRDGVSSITHVTNLFLNKVYKTNEAIRDDIRFSITFIEKLKSSSFAFQHSGVQSVIGELIGKEFATIAYNSDGSINSYYKDAFTHQREVENCYTSASALVAAYNDSKYFKVEHRNVRHLFSDQDVLIMDKLKGRRRILSIVQQLEHLDSSLSEGAKIDEDGVRYLYRLIEKQDILFTLYCHYGLPFLEELKYHKTKMRKAFFDIKVKSRPWNYSNMVDEIVFTFKLNKRYNSDEIRPMLQEIYKKYSHTDGYSREKKAKATDIMLFFDGVLYDGKKKHPIHGYKSYYILSAPKFRLSDDLAALEN